MRFGCVISAAGRGERFGMELPKALYELDGRTMVARSADAAAGVPGVVAIVVAAPLDHRDAVQAAVADVDHPDLQVVPGGDTRTASVRAAVAALPTDVAGILVHDAARPFAPRQVFESVMASVAGGSDAVVPGVAVVDTIKEVDDAGVVVATPDRSRLRAIQTPQGFRASVLRRALAAPEEGATDDAQMVERLGTAVHVIPGHPDAIKVTTAADLAVVADILSRRQPDVH